MISRAITLVLACMLLASCATTPSDRGVSGTAQWQGSWQSALLPTIAGNLHAELPFPLQPGQTFTVPVTITYAADSPYLPGISLSVDFELTVFEAGPATGGGHRQHDAITAPMQLKGSPQAGQTLSFSTNMPLSGDAFSGEYQSLGPADTGSFELRRS